jgi:hypothetical protein
LVEVLRHQAVAGPLREEGEDYDGPCSAPVSGGKNQGAVAEIQGNRSVVLERGLDFLVLVLHNRILFVAVGVVVRKRLESLSVAALGHENRDNLQDEE